GEVVFPVARGPTIRTAESRKKRSVSISVFYYEEMSAERSVFRMGRLDHVHIRVPDRAEAARWYSKHLGFEPVGAYDFWATGFEGGPLQISADGGRTTLALFEASEGHPMVPQETGVAFSVDADSFMSFARSLPCGIQNPLGEFLALTDLVDLDLCWAFNLVDPWGNQYELNCYEYDRVRVQLVEADAVPVVRYWSRELYMAYGDAASS
ncbi:MAG: VOC family protein, partial [Acidimicrobiales bacterium]